MEENTYLDDYKQQWLQDGREIEQMVDVPLSVLHENIARHERRKRGRMVWATVSAAACVALAVGVGLRIGTADMKGAAMPMVAQNHAVMPTSTAPATTCHPAQKDYEKPMDSRGRGRQEYGGPGVASTRAATPLQGCMPEEAPVEVAELEGQTEALVEPAPRAVPMIGGNVVETTQLVATAEPTVGASMVETQTLVKVVAPSRNTFREAIVEPLLALATSDL